MPSLNVSRALRSPKFVDKFDVTRRAEVVSATSGRSVLTPTVTRNVSGVVCAAHGNDLQRLDDSQRMGRNLSIVTEFRLQGPTPGKQPDLVTWKGDSFVVKLVDPYPQYGPGFVQAIVGSIDIIDQPIPG